MYQCEYEEGRKLLDADIKTEVQLETDGQLLLVIKEEPLYEQEENPSLDQENLPGLLHIKQEQEELWTIQEGEQLRGLEEEAPVPVKSEEDDEENPLSLQFHPIQSEENGDAEHLHFKTEADGEDCGGSVLARDFNPDAHLLPATHDKTSNSSEAETDDSDSSFDWEEIRKSESKLNRLQNDEAPDNPSECAQQQTGVKPFSCSICGSKYSRKYSLTAHMRLHSEGKRFSCSVCKKTFQQSGNLVEHMRVHTGEKPFSCPFCDRRFAHSSGLTSHIRVHTGEKPFTCSVCKASFSFSSNLSAHMRMHTADKPFGCTVCEKTFSRKEYLTQHLTVHMEEKPFSCSVCGKGFRDGGTLKRHLPVHTGEKPFSCSVCSKGFADKRNLTRHLKIHNREKCVGESSGSK
ncbi:zinc finger protein 501-like [Morone saxatilis]|uniref:zinc finger protein 501-like n=1 Tax=Morone saxatilis TaxID=34816 RepID=UPI0015E2437C|nr:zinc finger protein 501-like [Morone saxatilis]